MKVSGVDPKTGNEVEIQIENPESGFFDAMSEFEVSDEGIKKLINALNISADSKSLLYTLSKATIRVGEYIIKIGRKILDAVCHVFLEFPMTTFGTVFGGIVGTLISSVPIIGQLLGPIVTPILMALGLVGGLAMDIQDKLLERKISLAVATFSPLSGR